MAKRIDCGGGLVAYTEHFRSCTPFLKMRGIFFSIARFGCTWCVVVVAIVPLIFNVEFLLMMMMMLMVYFRPVYATGTSL